MPRFLPAVHLVLDVRMANVSQYATCDGGGAVLRAFRGGRRRASMKSKQYSMSVSLSFIM